MIEIHFHLLFGLDDGPETIESSLALAEASIEAISQYPFKASVITWPDPIPAAECSTPNNRSGQIG